MRSRNETSRAAAVSPQIGQDRELSLADAGLKGPCTLLVECTDE